MADLVAPFQGERYAAVDRLSSLIAPPYDVIDQAERARYAALAAENIVHVMLPEAPPGKPEDDRYGVAAERLAAWRRDGVLRRDARPTLYVLAQDFTLPTGERLTRRGVFAAVAAGGRTSGPTPGRRPIVWHSCARQPPTSSRSFCSRPIVTVRWQTPWLTLRRARPTRQRS